MARESKRLREIREKIEPGKAYPIDEAFALLKQFATAKFDESVEVAVNLGVDTRKSDQVVRGATVLPRGTGKQVRVAVFAQGARLSALPPGAALQPLLLRPSGPLPLPFLRLCPAPTGIQAAPGAAFR